MRFAQRVTTHANLVLTPKAKIDRCYFCVDTKSCPSFEIFLQFFYLLREEASKILHMILNRSISLMFLPTYIILYIINNKELFPPHVWSIVVVLEMINNYMKSDRRGGLPHRKCAMYATIRINQLYKPSKRKCRAKPNKQCSAKVLS